MYVNGCGRANAQIRGLGNGIVRWIVAEYSVINCCAQQQQQQRQQRQQSTDSDGNGDEYDSDEVDKDDDDGDDDDNIKNRAQKPFKWRVFHQWIRFESGRDVAIRNNNNNVG